MRAVEQNTTKRRKCVPDAPGIASDTVATSRPRSIIAILFSDAPRIKLRGFSNDGPQSNSANERRRFRPIRNGTRKKYTPTKIDGMGARSLYHRSSRDHQSMSNVPRYVIVSSAGDRDCTVRRLLLYWSHVLSRRPAARPQRNSGYREPMTAFRRPSTAGS